MRPATRITLSNEVSEEFLCRELSRHGKVVSPIKKVLSGWMSSEFNIHLHIKVDDFDDLFATSSNMKCFGC